MTRKASSHTRKLIAAAAVATIAMSGCARPGSLATTQEPTSAVPSETAATEQSASGDPMSTTEEPSVPPWERNEPDPSQSPMAFGDEEPEPSAYAFSAYLGKCADSIGNIESNYQSLADGITKTDATIVGQVIAVEPEEPMNMEPDWPEPALLPFVKVLVRVDDVLAATANAPSPGEVVSFSRPIGCGQTADAIEQYLPEEGVMALAQLTYPGAEGNETQPVAYGASGPWGISFADDADAPLYTFGGYITDIDGHESIRAAVAAIDELDPSESDR